MLEQWFLTTEKCRCLLSLQLDPEEDVEKRLLFEFVEIFFKRDVVLGDVLFCSLGCSINW